MVRYKDKEKSPPERMKEPDLAELLGEALKTDSGAAFKIMLGKSGILSRIISSGSDFRWVALRSVCTFERPDLVRLVQERDEVRRILDDASASEGYDRALIQGLRERYRCTLLDEALIVAAQNGDDEQAGRLLEMGADANARGQHGQTPLTAAASCGFGAGVIELLLEQGAKRDETNWTHGWRGKNALEIAIICGHDDNKRALNGCYGINRMGSDGSGVAAESAL